MKKILSLLLALCLCFGLCLSLTSCGEVLEILADFGEDVIDLVGDKAGEIIDKNNKGDLTYAEFQEALNTTNVSVRLEQDTAEDITYYFADGIVKIEQDGEPYPEYLIMEEGVCYLLSYTDGAYIATEAEHEALTLGDVLIGDVSYDELVYNSEDGTYRCDYLFFDQWAFSFSEGRLVEMKVVASNQVHARFSLFDHGRVAGIALPEYRLPTDGFVPTSKGATVTRAEWENAMTMTNYTAAMDIPGYSQGDQLIVHSADTVVYMEYTNPANGDSTYFVDDEDGDILIGPIDGQYWAYRYGQSFFDDNCASFVKTVLSGSAPDFSEITYESQKQAYRYQRGQYEFYLYFEDGLIKRVESRCGQETMTATVTGHGTTQLTLPSYQLFN